MSEAVIQKVLAKAYYDKGMIFHNATFGGFEADFLLIRKSQISHEFEIKCSKSDYRRDFTHKTRGVSEELRIQHGLETTHPEHHWRSDVLKHDVLQSDCPLGPQRFSFCCPEGLLTPEEVPEQYGLIYIKNMDGDKPYVSEIREAKMLHKVKASDAVVNRLVTAFYNNRVYKETFSDYLQSLKDEKQRSIERKARAYDKHMDAMMTAGLRLGTCETSTCTKPMIRGEGLESYCWICKRKKEKEL